MIVRMRVVNEDSTINCLQGRKPTFEIDFRRFKRLRYSVSQPPKLCKLPKLPKSNIPMRPIVFFFFFPTYQMSKHLTNNALKPMTDESRYKQAKESTENLLDATKTIQIPEDHKL